MNGEQENGKEKVVRHYSKVDHESGPAIYVRSDMYDAVFDLGHFRELPKENTSRFIDLMSGVKCLVASEISKRAKAEGIPIETYCLDIAFEGVDQDRRKTLEDQGFILHAKDITEGTGYESSMFQRAAERFGIKNYEQGTQKGILREIKRIMTPGGYLVLADMVSPETSYEWMQTERRRKSRHTVGEENAFHHIPTLEMWFDMLGVSGFDPKKDDIYQTKSLVKTEDWVESNQMDEEGMKDMNNFLLSASERVKKDFNIRQEDGSVRIDYPVVVITARSV